MRQRSGLFLRALVIGLTAFLTVVDLFATQAILPTLTRAYGVTPAAMGLADNSCTLGMAGAGLLVSLFSRHLDRRSGILISLALLSIPTALLSFAPDLITFAALRIMQGLCMASAFTLTLAYLGEECSAADTGSAFAAYITGNVASNLVGRLISAALADHLGLAWNFCFFAGLNLAGAALVYFTVARAAPMAQTDAPAPSPAAAWIGHLQNPQLRAAFGIGFCILFAFIGTLTYVNFVLVRAPLRSARCSSASFISCSCRRLSRHCWLANSSTGSEPGLQCGAHSHSQPSGCRFFSPRPSRRVLTGMVLVAVGTFFAQATATGFVEPRCDRGPRLRKRDLFSPATSPVVSSARPFSGQVFDRAGWAACVAGIALSLVTAALLARAIAYGDVRAATRCVPLPLVGAPRCMQRRGGRGEGFGVGGAI